LTANDPKDRASSDTVADTLGEIDQLCRLAESLGTTLDVGELAERALDPLLTLSRADRALVYLGSEKSATLNHVASREWPAEPALTADDLTSLEAEAYGFDEAADLPPALRPLLPEGQGPISVAPLRVHSRLLGVVVLGRSEGAFEETTLKLLTAGVRTLALAVENSSLFEDLDRSYRQLMNAQAGLIRSERFAALGQLSATLAHEIRNPLATIFSAISQIRKHGRPNETQDTLLDIAEEEAARLNNMVSGLLDFARPRKPAFEEGRPLEIARAVVRALAEDEQIPESVELTIADDTDNPTTRLDSDLVHKAITHLLRNAITAVEHDGGQVSLSVSRPLDRPDGAMIEVTDNGPGIQAEMMPRVLEPFFSTSPSGTGLGLPTVKRIAEDHRGTLAIDSTPGTGTVVRGQGWRRRQRKKGMVPGVRDEQGRLRQLPACFRQRPGRGPRFLAKKGTRQGVRRRKIPKGRLPGRRSDQHPVQGRGASCGHARSRESAAEPVPEDGWRATAGEGGQTKAESQTQSQPLADKKASDRMSSRHSSNE